MPVREILDAYRAARDPGTDTAVLCHAPFLSLNFEQSGRVTSCCYNRDFVLGTYPEQSVREIWTGEPARVLRDAFLRDAEAPGCDLCFYQLRNRNFSGTLMRNFDRFSRAASYRPRLDAPAPHVLEFEIANTCNLECVMCSGHWSSSIRAHREQLPPLRSPYDRAFVEQLDEFLPSIVAAKFLGGEPFLIKRYYEIWERIRRSNPDAQLTITTNASVLPERARQLLEQLRVNLVISLDALSAPTYEKIRRNASFAQVMVNLEYLLDYTRRMGTALSLAICPMTWNWRELPLLLEFCETRQLQLYFNTVLRPAEASLGGLDPDALRQVAESLERVRPEGDAPWTAANRRQWDGLVSQLRGWLDEKQAFGGRCAEFAAGLRAFAERHAVAPEHLERWALPLVTALQIAWERAGAEHLDMLTLLPRIPLPLPENGASTGTEQALLAAHLLARFLDEGKPRGRRLQEPGFLVAEQRRLRDYLEWLGERDGGDFRAVEELGSWLRERIRRGEGQALLDWVGMLLPELEGLEPAALEAS